MQSCGHRSVQAPVDGDAPVARFGVLRLGGAFPAGDLSPARTTFRLHPPEVAAPQQRREPRPARNEVVQVVNRSAQFVRPHRRFLGRRGSGRTMRINQKVRRLSRSTSSSAGPTSSPPRWRGKRMPNWSPDTRFQISREATRFQWKRNTWCQLLSKGQSVAICAAVGDVFQRAILAHAIQREVRRAELVIERVIVSCERHRFAIVQIVTHCLNAKLSKLRLADRIGRADIDRNRESVIRMDWQPQSKRHPQTIPFIELGGRCCMHEAQTCIAKFFLHEIRPNFVVLIERDMRTGPGLKQIPYTHHLSHELIPAVEAGAQIKFWIRFRAFEARLAQRQGAGEHGGRVGWVGAGFKFVSHGSAYLPGQDCAAWQD